MSHAKRPCINPASGRQACQELLERLEIMTPEMTWPDTQRILNGGQAAEGAL